MVMIGKDETPGGLILTEIANHTVTFHAILGILEILRKFPQILRNFSFGPPTTGPYLLPEPDFENFSKFCKICKNL